MKDNRVTLRINEELEQLIEAHQIEGETLTDTIKRLIIQGCSPKKAPTNNFELQAHLNYASKYIYHLSKYVENQNKRLSQ